jgi:hypothetical protein
LSNGYSIILTETQRQKIVSRCDERVAEKVIDRLQTKQDELQWVESHDQLSRRFQTFFGKDGVHFAEPGFKAHRSEWRAILILIRKANTFVFHREVEKEGSYNKSRQKDLIHNLKANPKDAKKKALDVLMKIREGKEENLLD